MTEPNDKITLEDETGQAAKKPVRRRAPRKKKTEPGLETHAVEIENNSSQNEPGSGESVIASVPEPDETPVEQPVPPDAPVEAPAPQAVSPAEPAPVPAQAVPAPQPQPPVQQYEAPRPEPVYGEGIIEVSGKGFGFLRDPKRNFVQNPQDIFVTPEVVRRYSLRDGMWLKGEIRRGNRGPQLFRLIEVNGEDPEKSRNLPTFDELTVVSPDKRIRLETVPERYTTRIMDMMTPIGKGQRGLIVAPPRTGKTTLLQHIADAVVKNHPEMKLIMLLVDERPEEVTEIRRTVPSAEIMASSNDSDLKSHTRIAQLAIERARRLVEAGKHVFVLLDSITRVGRAFNNAMGGGGRTMSGGIDARALEIPRKLFASARNTEEAGSLTIIATALIETGSRMDELIFQEFKGTGNMELVLDRKISDLRIYPAIDIFKSGTRREELLLPAEDLHKINVIRRGLSGHKPEEAIERLLSFVKKFPTNSWMLREIPG
jgi:transcription termination factor Rho